MRQAVAGTQGVAGGQMAGAAGAGAAAQDRAIPGAGVVADRGARPRLSRPDARQGVLVRAGRWWLRHWLRYAEVVGAQWR